MSTYTHRTETKAPINTVFKWHERRGAFHRLTPPWEMVLEKRADPDIPAVGSERVMKFVMGPAKMTWHARHTVYDPPHSFGETMLKGPFWKWDHEHIFEEKDGRTTVIDQIDYKVPFGFLGEIVDKILGGRLVKQRIDRMFKAREIRLQRDLQAHEKYRSIPRKKILIAGSSGLIGTQMVAFLDTGGHDVYRLVRRKVENDFEIEWDPDNGVINAKEIEGFDAVIHLGGEGIGDKRWSKKRKEKILTSRTGSTALLAKTLSQIDDPPEVFMVASAVGYYGHSQEENLTEESELGSGYLSDVCSAWEKSAQPAVDAGIRTIWLRTGIVLSGIGGALGKMLLPFKMNAGGPVASGKQWMPWISMDDQIYSMHELLMNESASGPYNLTAPNPASQKEFAKTLGRVLNRLAIAPLPTFVVRILFGKMGVTLLTQGQHVIPSRLQEMGYEFTHPDLEGALRDTLGMWKKE